MSSSDTVSWSTRAAGAKGTQLFWRLPDIQSGLPTMDILRRRYSKFYVGEDELALVAKGGVRTEISNPGVYQIEKDVTEIIFLTKGSAIRDWLLSEKETPSFADGQKLPMHGQLILRVSDPSLFVKEIIAGGGYVSDAVALDFLLFHVKRSLNDFVARRKLTRGDFEGISSSETGREVAEGAGQGLAAYGLRLESLSIYLGSPAVPSLVPREGELTKLVSRRLTKGIDEGGDALSSVFPGYGYRLRGGFERTDQAVRLKVAREILKVEGNLERLATLAYKARLRQATDQVKELTAELRNLRQTVEHAEFGESPFFGKQMKIEDQMTEHDVEAAIRFDALFLDTVNSVKNVTDQLLEKGIPSDEKDLLRDLQQLLLEVGDLRNTFMNRRDFMSQVGRVLEAEAKRSSEEEV